MAHVRTTKTDAIRAALQALPSGYTIVEFPVTPILADLAPCIALVRLNDDPDTSIDGDAQGRNGGELITNRLDVLVACVANDTATTDAMAAEVQPALVALAIGLGGSRPRLVATRFAASGEGKKPLHAVELHFSIWYRYEDIDPTTEA